MIIKLNNFQDGNGFISKQEIETIMGGAQMDEDTWKKMLDDCDTNKDGQVKQIISFYLFLFQISQAEFIELLMKKYV